MKNQYIFELVNSIKKRDLIIAITNAGKKFGYNTRIIGNYPNKVQENDILYLWNRHINQDSIAIDFKRRGGKVIVFENPYFKMNGYYSVGIEYPNNIKYSFKSQDNGERFKSFNLNIKDWRRNGTYILIATQAKRFDGGGLGYKDNRQPENWDSHIIKKLKILTDRPIVFRQHPNRKIELKKIKVDNVSISSNAKIVDDLKDAFATVVYTSNSSTESLLEGIPVFLTGSTSFMKEACNHNLNDIDNPLYFDNREKLFHRMAWNQFSLKEIEESLLLKLVLDIPATI